MEKKLSFQIKVFEVCFFVVIFFNLLSMLFAKFSIVISLQKNIKTHKNHISNNMVLRDNTRFFCLFVCLDCQWEKLKEPHLHLSMLPSTVKL